LDDELQEDAALEREIEDKGLEKEPEFVG